MTFFLYKTFKLIIIYEKLPVKHIQVDDNEEENDDREEEEDLGKFVKSLFMKTTMIMEKFDFY